jgi:RNA polymerase sigma-70 factor (ECF subfamily)
MTHASSKELDNDQVLALLGQVAQRDEPAFRRLYEATSRRVYAFAVHRLHDPAAAAEIVSETLYEVWRRPEAFRGEARFTTWLLGIARHKLLDRLQGKASRREDMHEDIDEHHELPDSAAPEGFHAVAERQRREGVAACMERLPDEQRECLHLLFYDGLSVADIAAVQGAPEGTVKTRLFHARAKIKQCLQRMLVREGVEHDRA